MADFIITVVVCTYNREALLPNCLESLCTQTLSSLRYEIIVVNNASTDRTTDIIQDFQSKYPELAIHHILETEQGLGYARNTGWLRAKGKFVAYIDDDAIASNQWLEQALEIISGTQPTPICIGGPIGVFYTVPQPDWFEDKYEIRSLGDESRLLQVGESFNGSNMIWDKVYLEKFKGFDVDKGVTGDYLSVGEETGLFRRIWQTIPDAKFVYSPNLEIKHFVAPVKLTLRYRWKRAFVTGFVIGSTAIKDYNMTRLVRLKIVVRELLKLFMLMITSLREIKKFTYWQKWALEYGSPIVLKMGYMSAMLNIKLRFRRD